MIWYLFDTSNEWATNEQENQLMGLLKESYLHTGRSTSLWVIQHGMDIGAWLHNDGIKPMATKQCFPMNLGHFDFFY